jgi:hypothetical protein
MAGMRPKGMFAATAHMLHCLEKWEWYADKDCETS